MKDQVFVNVRTEFHSIFTHNTTKNTMEDIVEYVISTKP